MKGKKGWIQIKVDTDVNRKYKALLKDRGEGGSKGSELGALCDKHMKRALDSVG
jgi:hypothetical protein